MSTEYHNKLTAGRQEARHHLHLRYSIDQQLDKEFAGDDPDQHLVDQTENLFRQYRKKELTIHELSDALKDRGFDVTVDL